MSDADVTAVRIGAPGHVDPRACRVCGRIGCDTCGCPVCRREGCDDPTHVAPANDGQERHRPKMSPEERHRARVQIVLEQERARREARRRLDAEEQQPVGEPEIVGLDTWLDEPDDPIPWRIRDLMAVETRVLLTAQFKSGKTILVTNLLRSLVDGDPFLGRYDVMPITDGKVAALDFEMSPRQFKAWLKAQRIENRKRIIALCFRGKSASFNILDSSVRQRWVERFRERDVRFLTIDCLRPIFDGLGLDEHKDAGRFLVALDALCDEAGILECWVVHHMGHDGERARGDSRLRDWPDVELRLVRQDDDPASPRYLSAYGRDVEIAEARLDYDHITRRLTLVGGSRREARVEIDLKEVHRVLTEAEKPLSQRAIYDALRGLVSEKRTKAALERGIRQKDILTSIGPHNATLHYANPLREASHAG